MAEEAKRKPEFIARVKEDPEGDRWITAGAAWTFKEGTGLSVRLKVLPVNFDGSFILVPPKEDEGE